MTVMMVGGMVIKFLFTPITPINTPHTAQSTRIAISNTASRQGSVMKENY